MVGVVIAVAVIVTGCGGDGDDAPAPARPAETVDPAAKGFPGGAAVVNEPGGFSVAVPHGWSATADGAVSLLVSPDKAVSVAVTADRSEEALAEPPDSIARTAITGLPGFTSIKVVGATPFKAAYPGVQASGSAIRTTDNLRQAFRSFVLVRAELAVFTALATRGAKQKSPFAQQVDSIVRSLRGRPVSVPG